MAADVPISTGFFAVGGRRLAVRCEGRAHWDDLTRTLLPALEGPANFRLELRDVAGTGGRPERDSAETATFEGHGEALLYTPCGRTIRHLGPDFDLRFDSGAGAGSGWLDTAGAPGWLRLRPWQRVLVAALATSGVESVHAAMVARSAAGVLLPGPNGSGKSTVTFACLAAGMRFLGDDAIAVEGERASTIHAVAKLSEDALGRFPALAEISERFDDPGTDERAVRLAAADGPAIASARIAAVAFPRIVDADRSSVTSLAPGRAATELWRCALSAESWRLGAAFSGLSALAGSVPAYRLDVGRDPAGITDTIDSLIG
jgi:hypothetical protein